MITPAQTAMSRSVRRTLGTLARKWFRSRNPRSRKNAPSANHTTKKVVPLRIMKTMTPYRRHRVPMIKSRTTGNDIVYSSGGRPQINQVFKTLLLLV
jgi:hypothetical protein